MLKLAALALLTATATFACAGDPTGSEGDDLSAGGRADQATMALVQRYYDGYQSYMRDAYPADGKLAGYWIFAEAFDALLDGAQRHGPMDFRKYISILYNDQASRGWTSDFFDDESWMCLSLIRAYDVTHDRKYIDRAEILFGDIEGNGWTGSGIWWNRQQKQKVTASNFGPAIIAARLNERTGRYGYKLEAEHIYDYWYANFVDRTTGHVADHIDTDTGHIDWTKWTYNTGLAIGASIELYKITGNTGYLSHAYMFGDFLVHQQVEASPYGNVLHDDNCSGDCDAFKGIAFRYLAKLYEEDTSQTQYKDVLVASAAAIWDRARNSSLRIFNSNWNGGTPSQASLGAQASAVIALNIAAEDGL